ncbi:MAG TPA: zinc-binding dehydrogenase [Solirubrobacterales bacterium]|nr:zinc-binding dehydrogenase [Solirubrobacterales bacterium]
MRAVAVGPGQSLEIREVDDPVAGEGQVVVDVAACGICGSDLHMLPSGVLPEGAILGHELAGTVAATGPGVDGFSAGDRVCVYPFEPVDRVDIPLAMASGIGLGTNDGGYAERVACDAAMLWRLPDAVELEHGALVEPLAVGLHGIDVSGARPEQPVCVLGCGPIGAMTVVGLRARGFTDLVVVEPNPGRRELATRLGAPHVCGLDGVHEAVLGVLGGRAPEAVIECAGHVDAPALAVELVAPEGTVALVGMLEEPVPISQLNVMLKEAVLRGSFAYRPVDFDAAIAILAGGDVPADELITSRRPLAEAAASFDELRRPGTGELKILLVP